MILEERAQRGTDPVSCSTFAGKTRDTNSNFLAKMAFDLGIELKVSMTGLFYSSSASELIGFQRFTEDRSNRRRRSRNRRGSSQNAQEL